MRDNPLTFSLPRWRFTRWLAYAGPDIPREIRVALISSLYGTLPIFAGGVANTITVATVIAYHIPHPAIFGWLALEIAICAARLVVLVIAHRAAAQRRRTPTDLNLVLALAWSASLGLGTFLSVTSGDWVAATLACLSAAAMVGGTCFRNFAAPRLTALMIALTLGPCCLGAAFAGEPIMMITFLQIPFYLLTMTIAAFKLNRMMVATMRAERENGFRAHHDALTGLSNRSGLGAAMEALQAIRRGSIGLLYLDLDGFKVVNDTHGHAVGDDLLRMVGERLRAEAGRGILAARIGGDEFVVLCEDRSRAELIALAERLIARISEPYPLAEAGTARIGVSIGIALSPDHGDDLTSLLQAADRALYRSKSTGKGHCSLATRKTRDGDDAEQAADRRSA
ncbi:GGDEF domain-containing protein [Methylobacterium brachythecii]|uniref:Diguanylate cyclase (GGDEF)-like protein n=1 Tax=Methylobacterium brachythecii TaxID=1176177 RepID=A0A7W6F7M5_9HYPH|nr:GGDEF domain-containing protein [Methylobacterium brachythecii]MBB3903543.1 diguanylate cyclase (GGDEF)-like protein [Methylobacterium brachythecii]GLS44105.1 GGDEF domain-containing protein [Methylobacterium brachythecii]